MTDRYAKTDHFRREIQSIFDEFLGEQASDPALKAKTEELLNSAEDLWDAERKLAQLEAAKRALDSK